MRPNAPRLVTVVVAVVLLVVGLALVFYQAQAVDLAGRLPLGRDVTRQIVDLVQQRVVAWAALALSPLVLIVGSLVRGM